VARGYATADGYEKAIERAIWRIIEEPNRRVCKENKKLV